ncbi:MAG TPA: pyridine nucleotide-disulfide oxidoreductase, partial [Chitinophagaceae bacterium]
GPVTISQISFDKKEQVIDHMLMAGDAAGMITPLCGNGMSMALHAAKLLAALVNRRLNDLISQEEMENEYVAMWNRLFAKRLRTGRIIQSFFGSPVLSNILISSLKQFPSLVRALVDQTHGTSF